MLKTKVPFRQDDKDGKWHFISSSAPNAAVTAEHFCQVQIQILVTGESKAYLVSWCACRLLIACACLSVHQVIS